MKTISRVMIIVLSIILVLAMSSCEPDKEKEMAACTSCKGSGLVTCPVLVAYINHFDEIPRSHDCASCTNGTANCSNCNGTGKIAIN